MRIAVIGGPRCGKSTFSLSLGLPVFCTDPKSMVKEPVKGVTYLPEITGWSEQSEYVSRYWLNRTGDWVIEGVGVVRALRKWAYDNEGLPVDELHYFKDAHPSVKLLDGQARMGKGVETMWADIAGIFRPITKEHRW